MYAEGQQKLFEVHRLIIAAFNGWPEKGLVVNHKDNNGLNNNIENLEYVTRRENASHVHQGKLSGVTKKRNRYQSQISIGNKMKYLGIYDTPEEASQAYQNELKKLGEVNRYAERPNDR